MTLDLHRQVAEYEKPPIWSHVQQKPGRKFCPTLPRCLPRLSTSFSRWSDDTIVPDKWSCVSSFDASSSLPGSRLTYMNRYGL